VVLLLQRWSNIRVISFM